MKIVHATDYGSPFPGSFVPMLVAALKEAEAHGWEMRVVLPARARERRWLAMLSEREEQLVFAPRASRRARGRWLAELVDGDGPTILHSHFSVLDYAVSAIARRRENVRAFWHIHTVFSGKPRVRLANRYKLAVASRPVERILCVAPHLADEAIRRGAPAGKVVYFPNGLDIRAYVAAPAPPWRRAAARELLGLPQEATVLVHFGRDWLLKGGDVFLQALRLLRERDRTIVALCARGGEPAERLATELGISEAVFTGEPEHTADLYAAADLLVSSSRREGMPLTVLEALAGGLPVVASDIPGHHVPGADLPSLAIVPLEPEAIASAVRSQLDRDEDRAALEAERSGRWLAENMDVSAWARRLMDLYERPPEGKG